MKIINNILVPTDFSACAENAYQFALQLAAHWKSSIKLLHIVSPDYGVTDLPVLVDLATKEKIEIAQQLLKDFKDNGLAKAKASLPTEPIVNDEIKVSGLPYSAIVSVAEEAEVDLILMGTNDYHSAWESAFGTNAASVVKQAHCHVLVVPELATFKNFSTVGFAADLHETDPYHLWKLCKMMEPFHPVVRCVHIEEPGKTAETEIKFEEMKEFFANNTVALQITFQAVEEDSIQNGLVDFANDWKLDLIAMPSIDRDALSRIFHISITKQMAVQSKIPLLVMK